MERTQLITFAHLQSKYLHEVTGNRVLGVQVYFKLGIILNDLVSLPFQSVQKWACLLLVLLTECIHEKVLAVLARPKGALEFEPLPKLEAIQTLLGNHQHLKTFLTLRAMATWMEWLYQTYTAHWPSYALSLDPVDLFIKSFWIDPYYPKNRLL